ncbi:MAG: hypothetical protein ABI553_01945 [Chloroflexota bacterium]
MNRWSTRHGAPAILSVVLLAGACASAPPSATTSTLPTTTFAPPPSAAGPSVGVVPSAAPTESPSPASTEPPRASLVAEGGDLVIGQLGTFTWGDGGSDSPWLPGAPIKVGSGETLTVSIGGGVDVESWTAARVPGGTTNGAGAVAMGSGAAPITFAAPGPGAWSIHVTVQFAGVLGSASYYWLVTVG